MPGSRSMDFPAYSPLEQSVEFRAFIPKPAVSPGLGNFERPPQFIQGCRCIAQPITDQSLCNRELGDAEEKPAFSGSLQCGADKNGSILILAKSNLYPRPRQAAEVLCIAVIRTDPEREPMVWIGNIFLCPDICPGPRPRLVR